MSRWEFAGRVLQWCILGLAMIASYMAMRG